MTLLLDRILLTIQRVPQLICSYVLDELVKSQKWDGKVKSSKCKACES